MPLHLCGCCDEVVEQHRHRHLHDEQAGLRPEKDTITTTHGMACKHGRVRRGRDAG